MKYIPALFLMSVLYTNCDGQNKSELSVDARIPNQKDRWKIKGYNLPNVHTETTIDGVTIQNSYPKGDRYPASNGKGYGVAVFWTRVINESALPLELKISFSSDTLANLSSPDQYEKVFLPPDTMTLEKMSLYGYGLSDLRSFLDTGLNKPTMVERTLNPNDECLFYVLVVGESIPVPASEARGPRLRPQGACRTALVQEGQNLFYRISIGAVTELIPCGQITVKK